MDDLEAIQDPATFEDEGITPQQLLEIGRAADRFFQSRGMPSQRDLFLNRNSRQVDRTSLKVTVRTTTPNTD